ncbi:MAG: hypothetical protein ABIH85_00870 [Candidatus Omnitrophota bacterium]|nr:hypothetical protein [Candidatus Omnitrophota bacterium]MBU1894485.1 hypothetical protein [Candidatus Omnitrophota bacterium]
MKRYLVLYVSLLSCIFFQVFFLRQVLWFPDIILLMVVFVGIFLDVFDAIIFGFAAGFLSACFSVDMMVPGIIIFPISAVVSAVLAKMFYKQNFAVQGLISFVVIIVMIVLQTCYFNIILHNTLELVLPISANWKQVAVTVLFSPIFFMLYKPVLRIKD